MDVWQHKTMLGSLCSNRTTEHAAFLWSAHCPRLPSWTEWTQTYQSSKQLFFMWYKLLPGTVLCYINDGSPLQIVPINWKPYLCAEINRALFRSLGLVNAVVSWILEPNQNSKQRGKSLQLLFKTQGGEGIKRSFSNVIGQVLDNRKTL